MALSYNGVEFSYVLTEKLSHVAVHDPSGTDLIYQRVVLNVRAIVTADIPPATGDDETAGDVVARVRHMLLSPRRRLTYTAPDGTVLLDVIGVGTDPSLTGPDLQTDVANGPKPLEVDVRQIAEGSILVAFTVEAYLTDCPENVGNLGFLSLKWSENTSYDQLWRCVKTRRGELRLPTLDGLDPDTFRGLVTPGVPPGFRRERADYRLDETNTKYAFEFVDREMMRPPPAPSVRITGRQIESVPLPGANRGGSIQLRLEGPKGVPPRELMNAGIRIATTRALAAGALQTGNGRLIIGLHISESLADDENVVEVGIEYRAKPVRVPKTGAAEGTTGLIGPGAISVGVQSLLDAWRRSPAVPPVQNPQGRLDNQVAVDYGGWLGNPLPGSDPNRAIAPPLRGTADRVKVLASLLNDPCGQIVELRGGPVVNALVAGTYPGGTTAGGTTPDGGVVTVTEEDDGEQVDDFDPFQAYNTLDADDGSTTLFADDATPGVYDHYFVEAHYTDNTGLVMMPSTKSGEKAAFAQLHNRTAKVEVSWAAARVGGPPVIPNPDSQDTNIRYLKGTIAPAQVKLAADGVSPVYEVTGSYSYGVADPTALSVVAPIPPFLSFDLAPEARKAAQMIDMDMVFYSGDAVNPFTGTGTQIVSRGGTSDLTGTPTVNP